MRRDLYARARYTTLQAHVSGRYRSGVCLCCDPICKYRGETRIRRVVRREETVIRHGGHGDSYRMTWATDDRQYSCVCDGAGLVEPFKGLYNSRLFAIEGGPQRPRFQDVVGYPLLAFPPRKESDTKYYGFGTLALEGCLYQFMSSPAVPVTTAVEEMKKDTPKIADTNWFRYNAAKLIYSPDNGRTWCNQDVSTPVVWEDWNHRSRDTLVFFEEDQEAFSLLSELQMGKNYERNRDGYIYVYSPNGNTEGTMNELVMFRVPKRQILERGAYQYFAGVEASGTAKWTIDIQARKPVHTFPRGWVNRLWQPWAWMPSVVYNAPLGFYMMACFGNGIGTDFDAFLGVSLPDTWFAKPSYLGFWIARNPWGPWTQVHEETAWMPAGDSGARAYSPEIASRWVSADGRSFWLVWSDYQVKGDKSELPRLFKAFSEKRDQVTLADHRALNANIRRLMPYYSFNVQRVDLELV